MKDTQQQFKMDVWRRIKKLCADNGANIREVIDCYDDSHFMKYEKGLEMPKFDKILKICNMFEVKVDIILHY